MIYVHFIINPVSGSGKSRLQAEQLRHHFPRSQYRIEADQTRYKGHAPALTREIALKNPDIIVACGGDGTINEVASVMVGTGIRLGIVPMGSGNGLAAHLHIPKSVPEALRLIRDGESLTMDVGCVNGQYFFSNMGIGIDADIIARYERSGRRRLSAYVLAALRSAWSFRPVTARVSVNEEVFAERSYLLFVSNSNEMGYGMSLTPKARLSDGFLDVFWVGPMSFLRQLSLGMAVVRKKAHLFRMARTRQLRELSVTFPKPSIIPVQIDGEARRITAQKLDISILEHALHVIAG